MLLSLHHLHSQEEVRCPDSFYLVKRLRRWLRVLVFSCLLEMPCGVSGCARKDLPIAALAGLGVRLVALSRLRGVFGRLLSLLRLAKALLRRSSLSSSVRILTSPSTCLSSPVSRFRAPSCTTYTVFLGSVRISIQPSHAVCFMRKLKIGVCSSCRLFSFQR